MNKEERREKFRKEHPDHKTFKKLSCSQFTNRTSFIPGLLKTKGIRWFKKNHPEKYRELSTYPLA